VKREHGVRHGGRGCDACIPISRVAQLLVPAWPDGGTDLEENNIGALGPLHDIPSKVIRNGAARRLRSNQDDLPTALACCLERDTAIGLTCVAADLKIRGVRLQSIDGPMSVGSGSISSQKDDKLCQWRTEA